MKKRFSPFLIAFLFTQTYVSCLILAQPKTAMLKTVNIRVRDPFVYADRKSKTYYLYAQSANRAGSNFTGVEAYTSTDLKNWTPPHPVLVLPEDAGIISVWAPEMHHYKDKYYLFVTLTFKDTLPEKKPVNSTNWPEMHIRGTHVFYSDSPLAHLSPSKKHRSRLKTGWRWTAHCL
jgi:sucrose-6-phosphate hydrolase SacC (GH32 family)